MRVEYSTLESFKTIIGAASSDALPGHDFTSKALLEDLPPGQDIYYRVRFADIAEPGMSGETQIGHFRTAPDGNASVSFVWSGDTAGQGWGIDPAWRHANLPDHAGKPSGFFYSLRRSHLCRLSDSSRVETARRRNLAQHRHAREIRGRA
jgi:phosphodiesterase/alkaline phosphatase D-like protein